MKGRFSDVTGTLNFTVVVALLFALIRFMWLSDMEWKTDESGMFELAKNAVLKGKIPDSGLISGVGFINSGFSVFPFMGFYLLTKSALGMAYCVALINVAAIFWMIYINRRHCSSDPVIQGSIALMSVNVLAVIFSRKLWAQDLLPVFITAVWALHYLKNKKLSMLLMGCVLGFSGMLHLSGFFTLAGVYIAILITRKYPVNTWIYYPIGALIPITLYAPWLFSLFNGGNASDVSIENIYKFEYILHFITDPLGINFVYSLGLNNAIEFLKYPMIHNVPFFLVGAFSILILALTVCAIYVAVSRGTWRLSDWSGFTDRKYFFLAFVVFPGILLTFSGSPIRSHYLIAAMPFLFLPFSCLWQKSGVKIWRAVLAFQALITVLFLFYIHYQHQSGGDYGVPFRLQ